VREKERERGGERAQIYSRIATKLETKEKSRKLKMTREIREKLEILQN